MYFANRMDAGRQLAERCAGLAKLAPVVVGLARGGVPVAVEVAEKLAAPLDLLVVKKIGWPDAPEVAMGAISEGGGLHVDEAAIRMTGLGPEELASEFASQRGELDLRIARYRAHFPTVPVAGRAVLLVDDGVATGSTIRAAISAIQRRGATSVAVATPVIAADAAAALRADGIEVVALREPELFRAVSVWYRDFPQVTDEELLACLARTRRDEADSIPAQDSVPRPESAAVEVEVPMEVGALSALLRVPVAPIGLIIFVHGAGSSRFSPRNQHVARQLHAAGFATLLVDLLTPVEASREDGERDLHLDVGLLSRRVSFATQWAQLDGRTSLVPIGYFGASTGAAAALVAAATHPRTVGAVVCRGGRPDLAEPELLAAVRAPTLLIVGDRDQEVLALNRDALRFFEAHAELVLVPEAGHLFEEPGALDRVAELATRWFVRHLAAHQPGLQP